MSKPFSLHDSGIHVKRILRNVPPAVLYEQALKNEKNTAITSEGALIVSSGEKTGRSPKDKRIVYHPASLRHVNWGAINIKLDDHTFLINHERAIDYLNTFEQLYAIDGFAGWDPNYRIKVRVICSRAYHALFMHNMLIRPTAAELADFGAPDYTIYNAGSFPANRYTSQMTSSTSIDISFERGEVVILGTEYAGEMKKGVFTIMNHIMPKRGVLSMHCSANVGDNDDLSLFFGLSGTGKTTLSADPHRRLIGDDEHCWSDQGIFNIEGGCYAKCIGLSPDKEPEIFDAIRFGTILENVVYDPVTRVVDYMDSTLTENTRASYPIEYIANAAIPCVGPHPRNIIFLTCDAFGVLPPISKLTPEQAMYHFISGYTAKVAGTEVGVTEPQATFSACFGEAFMVRRPTKYAELLAGKIRRHQVDVWLINTGWSGGPYGEGKRIDLSITRAIVDAIHAGKLTDVERKVEPVFSFDVPTSCPNVPRKVLWPRDTWKSKQSYDAKSGELADLFVKNFRKYDSYSSEHIAAAGPRIA